MPHSTDELRGHAALGLLESLLVVLEEKVILTPRDVDAVFTAAIDAFRTDGRENHNGASEAVAALLERVQVDGNSVRKT